MNDNRKGIGGRRFRFELSEVKPAPEPERCTICGGPVEARPMKPGVCYDCYRKSTDINKKAEPSLYDVWVEAEKQYAADPTIENRSKAWQAWKALHPTASPYRFS